jgi:hypothetical protein
VGPDRPASPTLSLTVSFVVTNRVPCRLGPDRPSAPAAPAGPAGPAAPWKLPCLEVSLQERVFFTFDETTAFFVSCLATLFFGSVIAA